MDLYRIRRDWQGMGSFLCPPGHPNHVYVVEGFWERAPGTTPNPRARKNGPDMCSSLDGLLGDDGSGVPRSIRDQARRIMDSAQLVCSPAWVAMVYGYFRNSYAPESGDRDVSKSVRTGPPELHLGYLTVHQYFPEHQPDLALIADPGKGYGSWPCAKCGERVQYEARADALVQVIPGNLWRYVAECPKGGSHERESVTVPS